MIEAVGVSSTRVASQGVYAQAAASAPARAEPVKAPSPAGAMLYVKVNNDLNRAILEARSSEGDVIRQYPTEYQIRAIKLASSLQTQKSDEAQTEPVAEPQAEAAPQTAQPAQPAASAGSASVRVDVADTGSVPAGNSSTQSVVV